MSETKLYFTEQEKRTVLERAGYVFEKIDSWENVTEYHNHVETVERKIEICYHPEHVKITPALRERDSQTLLSMFSPETTFANLFKAKLFELLSK